MKTSVRLLSLLLLSAASAMGILAQTSPRFPNVVSTAADPLFTNLTIPANAATNGMWSTTFAWPIVGIHSTVMPDGRILTEGTAPNTTGIQDGRTLDFWTPQLGFAATSHLELPNAQNVDSFCGTVSVLPSTGNVMLSGGGGNDGYTSFLSTLVNPATTSVNGSGSSLAAQRWYSTMITLADGRALIGGGGTPYAIVGAFANPNSSLSSISVTPELYDPVANTWTTLMNGYSLDAFGPTNNHGWYPRMWLAPDGGVFGISMEKVWYLDTKAFTTTTLTNFKTTVDNTLLPNVGPTSTAVMYDTGKILQVGGNGYNNGYGSNSSPYATIFNITNPLNPVITDTTPMKFPRQWANSLVMPDGQVLVTGGTTYADSSGANNVPAVETWNPQTGAWTVGASAANYRGYHSTTALMQNGTVLSLGGGVPGPVQNNNGEIYYPAYLFTQSGNTSVLANRPTIVSVDTLNSNYSQPVNLEMADTSYVAEASLIGLSSTTHSFNTFQRRIKLTISQYGTVLTATMPQSANIAPPGYYLLTVLNGARVPSKAIIIALNAKAVAQQGINTPTPPTPPSATLPGNRIAQGFVKVAAASDGTLVGISAASSQLYISKSDGTATSTVNFTPMPTFQAKDVAVLSANSVYAIGMDNSAYHYSAGTWTQVGINALSIAASPDGTIALSNNVDNTTYIKSTDDNQQNWHWIPVRSRKIALVNKNSVYYIGQDGNAYRYDNVNTPVLIDTGVTDITASSDGRISVVTAASTVQTKAGDNTTQNWTTLTGVTGVSRIGSPNQNTLVLTYASGDVYLQSTASSTPTTSPSTVSITCSGVTYNGSAQTPCTATATGAGNLNATLQVTYANNTNAGTATASATFAGDSTHTGSSNTASFTIAPAPLTATAGSYNGVYDGNTHAPAACQVSANSGGITCSNQPATVGPNVGSGTITPTISGTNANYAVTSVNGTWAITAVATTAPAVSANSPVMGWASWNTFASVINYNVIKGQADAMVASGLASSKYAYVNIDEGWWQGQRDSNGNIVVSTTQWPGGMQAIAAYIHSKGLKAGIYSDAGRNGCGYYYPTGSPAAPGTGMEGHEYQDALQFQNWGFDFVKVDWCGGQAEGLDPQSTYQKISTAISQATAVSGKNLVLSICDWGVNQPWNWAAGMSAMWRTSTDIIYFGNTPTVGNMLTNFDAGLHPTNQHTGYVNDPDMLMVGMPGLTDAQNRLHIALWAISGAPLIMGNDLTKLTPATIATVTNPRAVAIDQDARGLQGVKVAEDVSGLQVYSKLLTGTGQRAVLLLNRTANTANITVRWTDLGLTSGSASFQDVWTGNVLGTATSGTSLSVASNDAAFLIVSGTEPASTTYEAESALNTFTGSAVSASCPTCSQGKDVRYVGNGATLTFNGLSASSTGVKALTIQYINGDPTPRMATLQVNGQLGTPVMFPPTGSWTTTGSVSVIVSLTAGATNTLAFSNPSAWTPDFDSVTVPNTPATAATGNSLQGVQSGRCLNIPTGPNVNGTQFQLQDCNSSLNQTITVTAANEIRVYGNMCVDAYNNGTQNGTVVDLWPCNGQTNQKWTFNSNGTITGNQSGLCLDASYNNTANGTPIQLWSCNGGTNQQWVKK